MPYTRILLQRVLGLIFGGKSAEHEVSLQSARSIAAALDKDKYDITYIGIDKQGRWFLNSDHKKLISEDNITQIKLPLLEERAVFVQGDGSKELVSLDAKGVTRKLDVVFPVLHGPFGEDGTVQGLLKLADVPFVGPGVLGSAVGMDKDVMKRLLRDGGIPIAHFIVKHKHENCDFNSVKQELGLPVFVKPANLGSSVGINRVSNEAEFRSAVSEAFKYDRKIIIEEAIKGREIECAVLGNESPIASRPGEVVPQDSFYSYKAKYIDEKGARLLIPAEMDSVTEEKVKSLAVRAFQVLCCEGLSRVDMFLKSDNSLIVNEINTIPGFTRISMYPKLWEASGISYPQLLDRLVELAIARYNEEKALKTSVREDQE